MGIFEYVDSSFQVNIADEGVMYLSEQMHVWCSWCGALCPTHQDVGLVTCPKALQRDDDLQLCRSWGCWPSPSAQRQHMLSRAACSTAGPIAHHCWLLTFRHLLLAGSWISLLRLLCTASSLKADRKTQEVWCRSLWICVLNRLKKLCIGISHSPLQTYFKWWQEQK